MPVSALLDRPEGLDPFDVSAVYDGSELHVPLKPLMPDAPIVPSLGRPAAGGDALELADLALVRGDAFDASAQYRALLPKLDASAAAYVTLQLARAYRELGDRDLAAPMLKRSAAGADALAWVALVELADLRAGEIGGVAAARELAPLAGTRAELLVDHLIHSRPDEEAAALLVEKAVRLQRCEFALKAFVLDPGLSPNRARPCLLELDSARQVAEMRQRNKRLVEYYDHLAPYVDLWEELADAVRRGNRDAEPWLVFAEQISLLTTYARASDQMASLSSIARSALLVATELALARPQPDSGTVARIRAISARLVANDEQRIRRHVNALLKTYGSQ
jgi:hypothetical protein